MVYSVSFLSHDSLIHHVVREHHGNRTSQYGGQLCPPPKPLFSSLTNNTGIHGTCSYVREGHDNSFIGTRVPSGSQKGPVYSNCFINDHLWNVSFLHELCDPSSHFHHCSHDSLCESTQLKNYHGACWLKATRSGCLVSQGRNKKACCRGLR